MRWTWSEVADLLDTGDAVFEETRNDEIVRREFSALHRSAEHWDDGRYTTHE